MIGATISGAVAASCIVNCDDGLVWCSDTCSDLATDPGNCGVCGQICAIGSDCGDASCAAIDYDRDAGDASAIGDCTSCLASDFATGTCAENLASCRADPICVTWASCVTSCFGDGYGSACFDECDEAGAPSSDVLEPVLSCACSTCAAACGALCPSDGGADASPDAPSDAKADADESDASIH